MRRQAAKGRKLFSLAAVCVLLAAVLAPAPASASRTLPRPTAPDLGRLPALELAGAPGADHAEPLPLYTFVDVVALDRVAGLDDDQVKAAVGRQRHQLHLVSTELAHPGKLVWPSKTATGVSTWPCADKHLEGSELSQKLHRPSFQGLWTDPVSGLSYARNRWYDARSASWLSEDPMGAVDSVNLYAFVGWGPHTATDPMGENLVDPAYTLDSSSPHYLFEGVVYRVSPSGMVWEQVTEEGPLAFQGYRPVLDRETNDVVLAMAGRSTGSDLLRQHVLSAVTAELSEEERAEAAADVFCVLPGSSDLCDAYVIATGKVPLTGEYVGSVEYGATTTLALLPFVAGHTFSRVAGEVIEDVDDVVNLVPGSAEHQAQRWLEYQRRGGTWEYDRWSNVYEHNMTRARKAHEAVNEYWKQAGWGKREVSVDVAPGISRRLDIADIAARRGVEHKVGRQYATAGNLWELARDRELRRQGWDISWHFEGRASAPLLRALDEAGIPHNLGD